ncbi:5779_t:CDS:2 [Cetraspora pellucida]|uniref:5779_t:CDS:1 n=1 Tax=Cetraspora pellucida TaxID=1433469 RepID=A0ACA9KKY6_9GLOM|nr:5779_t:CDS:2 [Cetraspora pellucida]
MLSWQRHEITQSLYYYSEINSNELFDNKFNEEDYNAQKVHLTSLLKELSSNDIVKTYKIQQFCQHFWHVLAIDDAAFFYITLISRHWYKTKKMQDSDLDKQPYMNAYSRQLNENYLFCPKFPPMYQIIKLRRDKAVHTAVEAGGDSIYCLKRILNNWFVEEGKLVHVKDDDRKNFDPN